MNFDGIVCCRGEEISACRYAQIFALGLEAAGDENDAEKIALQSSLLEANERRALETVAMCMKGKKAFNFH
jgi:hypothetical protein